MQVGEAGCVWEAGNRAQGPGRKGGGVADGGRRHGERFCIYARPENKCGMGDVFLAWIKNVFLSTLATQKATLCPRKTACFYKQSQNTPVKLQHPAPRAPQNGNIDFRRGEA